MGNATVLIVDDDLSVGQVLGALLQQASIEARSVSSVAAAVAASTAASASRPAQIATVIQCVTLMPAPRV